MSADVVEQVALPDGRTLVVRSASPDDRDDLLALYHRLSTEDLWLRFFTAAAPSPAFLEQWLTVATRGGLLLMVDLVERSGNSTLIAEAGYSLLDDGDGELGITVDPLWRGWLGPWLLAVLLREAAARDVPNLEAVIQVANRPMLNTLRRHGSAVMKQDSFEEIRLIVGTDGPAPSWPDPDRPRILVEASSGRWLGEDAARAAGFDVLTCRGPSADHDCPLLAGKGCPLVEDADVVVVTMPPAAAAARALIGVHRERDAAELIVPGFGSPGPDDSDTAEEVVEQIQRTLGLS